jgi:hypothetical protein
VAHAGAPAAIVQKLNQVVNATPTSPETFGQLLQREIKRWRPVVLNAKITAD